MKMLLDKELYEQLKNIDQHPKSIKKAVRYIKQDASIEQLKAIEKLIENAIRMRMKTIQKTS